jgi:hypothetical protein
MEKTRIIKKELINKVFSVIRSCKTIEQWNGAKKYVDLFFKREHMPSGDPLSIRITKNLKLKLKIIKG